jgi:hypothetical protein
MSIAGVAFVTMAVALFVATVLQVVIVRRVREHHRELWVRCGLTGSFPFSGVGNGEALRRLFWKENLGRSSDRVLRRLFLISRGADITFLISFLSGVVAVLYSSWS